MHAKDGTQATAVEKAGAKVKGKAKSGSGMVRRKNGKVEHAGMERATCKAATREANSVETGGRSQTDHSTPQNQKKNSLPHAERQGAASMILRYETEDVERKCTQGRFKNVQRRHRQGFQRTEKKTK